MPPPEPHTLWHLTKRAGPESDRFVADSAGRSALGGLLSLGTIAAPLARFRGKSLLVWCKRQRAVVEALLQLDGIAARLVLCPTDFTLEHLALVIAEAEIEAIVTDSTALAEQAHDARPVVFVEIEARYPLDPAEDRNFATEWVLFTSGTSDRPKLVAHTLLSLTGPVDDFHAKARGAVWSTFYDIRRYGGVQILLRALVGGASLVLSQAGEPVAAFLDRAASCGVTHISGTPSHWRRALMSDARDRIVPRYVRLSGEIADQAILDHLAASFPKASVAHAFASTEAGLAFEVDDGRAGFPASIVHGAGAKAELRVVDGSLRIRSPRTASRYLGTRGALMDAEGFVDTADMIDLRDGRYHFVGRREGVINVGGQKVHPEEVEAVISRLPSVRMVRVRAQRNPITGALVVADIVLEDAAADKPLDAIKRDIIAACRQALPAHKVPAMLRAVPSLDIGASGKLARRYA
ncbi:MAG TPA: AMP-binding protein [Stellaceae bacterium]|jgi:acyl-CoA synthetase (AMP-forming)/AMP-acid ligase II